MKNQPRIHMFLQCDFQVIRDLILMDFLDPPTPQNIEKCMGGPSKINKIEFSHMIMKVIGKSTPNRVENCPEIDPNRHQNVIASHLKNMLQNQHR